MEVLLHNWHNILLEMEGLHLCVESNRTKGEAKNEVRRPAGRAPSDVNSTRQPDVGRTPPCCHRSRRRERAAGPDGAQVEAAIAGSNNPTRWPLIRRNSPEPPFGPRLANCSFQPPDLNNVSLAFQMHL
jgi:hypothetical protein